MGSPALFYFLRTTILLTDKLKVREIYVIRRLERRLKGARRRRSLNPRTGNMEDIRLALTLLHFTVHAFQRRARFL